MVRFACKEITFMKKTGYALYTMKDRQGNWIDGQCYISEELAEKEAQYHANRHQNHMIECYTVDENGDVEVRWQREQKFYVK